MSQWCTRSHRVICWGPAGQQKVARAKCILTERQGLPERDACESMRAQPMAKRTTMVEIVTAIINANELLSFRPNRE